MDKPVFQRVNSRNDKQMEGLMNTLLWIEHNAGFISLAHLNHLAFTQLNISNVHHPWVPDLWKE